MHGGRGSTRRRRPPEPASTSMATLPGSVHNQQLLQHVFNSLGEAVAGQVGRGLHLGLVSFPVFPCGVKPTTEAASGG